MNKTYIVYCIIICTCATQIKAQQFSKYAQSCYIITKVATNLHANPKALNDTFSSLCFNLLINELDDDKTIFLQSDFEKLKRYEVNLHNEIISQKTNFLQLLYDLYKLRNFQKDSLTQIACSKPFSFQKIDYLSVKNDSTYSENIQEQFLKIEQKIKYQILLNLMDAGVAFEQQKKQFTQKIKDSIEAKSRIKIAQISLRIKDQYFSNNQYLQKIIGEAYCNSIAKTYDPHTQYFSLDEKKEFEGQLGGEAFAFGLSLTEDENNEGVGVDKIKPGSPAFKSGINKGDKLKYIQWDGEDKKDVREASEAEISSLLSGHNSTQLTLTLLTIEGTEKEVKIWKEKIEDSNEDRISSFVLEGTKKIGYISLPAFYSDWISEEAGLNGCANDVSKEIIKLKKENIEGLILDLRNNGGGSLHEASDLVGLFIDVGPVALLKTKEPKIKIQKETNLGTLYDDPLYILVNEYSASASELLASTLQDYNRAVVIGNTTFGKATGQVILPLDSTINFSSNTTDLNATEFIKITIEKIYRVTGKSNQKIGVTPDIFIEEGYESQQMKEASYSTSFDPDNIEANKYFKPYAKLNLMEKKNKFYSILDTSSIIKTRKEIKKFYAEKIKLKQLPLQWDIAFKNYVADTKYIKNIFENKKQFQYFVSKNHQYDSKRLSTDTYYKEQNELLINKIQKDNTLQLTYLFSTL